MDQESDVAQHPTLCVAVLGAVPGYPAFLEEAVKAVRKWRYALPSWMALRSP